MAIAADGVAEFAVNSNTLTMSLTTSGENRFLVVGIAGDNVNDVITGVTYAGVAMTLADKIKTTNFDRWNYVFVLFNPASGANDIVVSASSSVFFTAYAASYTGVNQTGMDATPVTNTAYANTLSTSITTVTDNAWAIQSNYHGTTAGALTATGTDVIRELSTYQNAGIVDTDGPISPAGARAIAVDGASGGPMSAVMIAIAPLVSNSNFFMMPSQSHAQRRNIRVVSSGFDPGT